MATYPIDPDVRLAAGRHQLDPVLVQAVVLTESSGQPWAWNPEPRYRWLWNVATETPFRPLTVGEQVTEIPPRDFPYLAGDRDQEWWGQQASWGLMQVMGAVAREMGFRGPYLSQLCEPVIGLEYGCRKLAALLRWAEGNTAKALGAYNAGPGRWASEPALAYVERVMGQREGVRVA